MNYHIVEARYIGGHVVWLRFRDGTAGEIDLESVLEGPIFEPSIPSSGPMERTGVEPKHLLRLMLRVAKREGRATRAA